MNSKEKNYSIIFRLFHFFFVIIKNRDSWDEHSKFNIARRSIKKSILLRTSDDYRYL